MGILISSPLVLTASAVAKEKMQISTVGSDIGAT